MCFFFPKGGGATLSKTNLCGFQGSATPDFFFIAPGGAVKMHNLRGEPWAFL